MKSILRRSGHSSPPFIQEQIHSGSRVQPHIKPQLCICTESHRRQGNHNGSSLENPCRSTLSRLYIQTPSMSLCGLSPPCRSMGIKDCFVKVWLAWLLKMEEWWEACRNPTGKSQCIKRNDSSAMIVPGRYSKLQCKTDGQISCASYPQE